MVVFSQKSDFPDNYRTHLKEKVSLNYALQTRKNRYHRVGPPLVGTKPPLFASFCVRGVRNLFGYAEGIYLYKVSRAQLAAARALFVGRPVFGCVGAFF